ncbi:hypothetical protein STANM309S_02559 [Streptomyces tanashiensis]
MDVSVRADRAALFEWSGQVARTRCFGVHWERDEVLTAMLRVGVTNEAGAARMQAIFAQAAAARSPRGVCPDPEDAPRRAALVASQILGMALTRYVLRLPPAVAMSTEEIVAPGWAPP